MLSARRALGMAALACAALTALAPAAGADTDTTVATWADTASVSPQGASWWAPGFTAGLALSGPITVHAAGITYTPGMYLPQVNGGQSLAMATYGTSTRGFTIMETFDGTSSPIAVDPVPNAAPVGQVLMKTVWLGYKGASTQVLASVSANCVRRPPKQNARCTPASVKRWGGAISLLDQPERPSDPFGITSVSIMATPGISYAQLVQIAKSLTQVPGAMPPPAGALQPTPSPSTS